MATPINPWAVYSRQSGGVPSPEDAELEQFLAEQQAQQQAAAAANRAPAGLVSNMLGITPPTVQAAPVAPVAKGSGLSAKNNAKQENRTVHMINEVGVMDPQVMQQAYNAISNSKEVQDQRAGIENMQDALNMQLGREQSPDLAGPLSYLANYVTGGKAHIINTPKDDRQKILDYADKLQDNKRDLTRQIWDSIGKLKGGSTQQQDYSQVILGSEAGAEDPAKAEAKSRGSTPEANNARFITLIQRDKGLQTANEALEAGAKIREILANPERLNPTALNNLALMITKLHGIGRPSNFELANEKGNSALAAKAEQFWEKLTTGKITEENRKQFLDYVEGLMFHTKAMADNRRNRFKNLAGGLGVSRGFADAALPDSYSDPDIREKDLQKKQGKRPDRLAPAAGKRTPEQEARLQELMKKEAAAQGK
jgi:hypothetical protein